jgi:DNA-binding SARP family transcriptional activator
MRIAAKFSLRLRYGSTLERDDLHRAMRRDDRIWGLSVEMRILGPLDASEADRTCPLPAGRSRIVLSVLALHANRVVSQDRLVAAAWGETVPATARTQLQGMISTLRQRLRSAGAPASAIATCGSGYRLNLEPDHLDLHLFHRLTGRARVASAAGNHRAAADALRRALALWRGPAFDGLHSDYLDLERTRLDHLRLAAIESYAKAQLELGRHTEAIVDLERAMEANPLHEGVAGLLMLAYYRAGRQTDALTAYQAIRRRLVDELGVEPGRSLHVLHRRILTADQALDTTTGPQPAGRQPTAALAQLPPDTTDFTGRATEVDWLRRLLEPELRPADHGAAVTITAIVGMGGLGKTTLALHVAHKVRECFPDGQVFLDLGGSKAEPMGTDQAFDRLLTDMGVRVEDIPERLDARAALYRSVLADRRILIVLDDAASAAQVRPLLPGTRTSAVLATSRQSLAGLAGLDRLTLDGLADDAARSLLAAVAGRGGATADPLALQDIVTACAGLPLAIRVAGARLATRPTRTLRDLADRLSDLGRLLDELDADDLSVRATIDSSYAALADSTDPVDNDAARAFAVLGGRTEPYLTVTCAASLLSRPYAIAEGALERLVDAHLLRHAERGYHFHPLVRAYAQEVATRTPGDLLADNPALVRQPPPIWLRDLRQGHANALWTPGTNKRHDRKFLRPAG